MKTPSVDEGVRVEGGGDDASDPGLDDLVHARGRETVQKAVAAAGLEVHVEVGPASGAARGAKRGCLRVILARSRVVARADHDTVADRHGSHERVRARARQTP